MSFKNQSVFSSVYTNTTFTITEDMQLSEVVIELMSGSATLLGGLRVPGLTLDPVAITVGQPVVLNADSGYTLTDITIDSTAGGVFEVYGTYQYNNGVDASAAAYFTATGITGAAQQLAIDNLVKSLKGYGLWSKMKAIYPFVTDNRNLWSYTNDVTAGNWVRSGFTATANSTTAPDGTTTADTLTENTSGGNHYISNAVSAIALSNGNCTMSIYVKKIVRDWFVVSLFDGTTGRNAWFNINTGTIGTVQSGATAYISNEGNGWYRCSITMPMSASNVNYTAYYGANADNSVSYTGNGLASYYVWGAQLEIGSLSTYQPIATTQQAYIASQFKYNLKDPRDLDAAFRLVFNGGWTFSISGAQGNGTNGYADTKFKNSNFTNYNSTSIFYYGNVGVNAISWDSGNINGTPNARITLPPSDTLLYFQFNSANINTFSTSSRNGFFGMNRISSTQVNVFEKNTKLGTVSETIIANANTNNFVIGNQFSSGTGNPSDRQFKFYTLGDGFTDTEVANYYIAVQTYQEALSRQVGVLVVSDPNAQAFIDAAQITDVTQADAINNLVLGLKYDNLWNKMTAIYPFVGGTATTHKYNLKDPRDLDAAYRLVFNGGWTHSSTGATPNGANGYADTFFTQTSMGMFANSHISYYARTVASTSGTKVEMGVGTGLANSYSNLAVGFSGVISINAGSRTLGFSVVDARGYVINSATSTSLKLYKNGSLLGTDSTTQLSSPSAFSLIIGAQSNGASRGNYTDRESAFASIGSGLTDADASNLYNRVQTYQTALSRQVS